MNKPQSTSYIVVPARLASTRLPRKMMLRETGMTVVQHTYEAASQARRPVGICVATDHEEIAAEVRRFGGNVALTDPKAPSGTDRVIELAAKLDWVDVFVNVQGDEPEISGEAIDLVVDLLEQNPTAEMSTLAAPIRTWQQVVDPACVKVVFDSSGRALYFSRSAVPHAEDIDHEMLNSDPPNYYQHIGLYAYRREFLLQLADTPPSRLEQLESLEQLRVLEGGHTIVVGVIDEPSLCIDTAENYRDFVDRWMARQRTASKNETNENTVTSR